MRLLLIIGILVALLAMPTVIDLVYENAYFKHLPPEKQEQIMTWLSDDEAYITDSIHRADQGAINLIFRQRVRLQPLVGSFNNYY